jgi:hypothetical protein
VATPKGLKLLCECRAVRDAIGYDVSLAADHFGPLDVIDSIKYARAFEPYDLAWAEDILQIGTLGSGAAPLNWQAYKEIKAATSTPLATGESLFGLEEGFRNFIENRAVSILHGSDPGAIRETQTHRRICLHVRDFNRRPLLPAPRRLHGVRHMIATIMTPSRWRTMRSIFHGGTTLRRAC